MATSLRSKVEEHLTCSVCLEEYKDPKVLPCLHSYCHECIVKLAKKANSGSIACPECRLTVKVDDPQNFSALPSNLFVNNLLATMALADDKKVKEILCDNCNTGDVAETRCKECRMFLCNFCTKSHKRSRATKFHKILSMEELRNSAHPDSFSEKIRCTKHEGEEIKLYCKTCELTICRDCIIVDHREHEYAFVEDVSIKEKENIQENLDEVKQRKARVLQGIANLKKFDEGLVAKNRLTIKLINDHFNKLMRVWEFRKTELVERAESLTTLKRKLIHTQLEQLEMASTSCESSIGFTEQAFKNGSDVQILSMRNNILECLDKLKQVKDQTEPCVTGGMVFVTPMTVDDTKNQLFDLITVDDVACPEKSESSFSEPSEDLEPGKQATIKVICNDMFNRRIQHGGQVMKPTFNGVAVSDVTVTDNNDGSHSVNFIPRSGGVLEFEVTINGAPAPSCSLRKNAKWVMSDAHGRGTISNGGLTISSEGYDGEYCYRVGGCYFESGIHTWKVRLSVQNQHLACYSTMKPVAEVGVIDCGEIDPNTKSSANLDILHHEKCVHICYWQTRQTSDIVLTLDMENKTLEVLEGYQCPKYDNYCQYDEDQSEESQTDEDHSDGDLSDKDKCHGNQFDGDQCDEDLCDGDQSDEDQFDEDLFDEDQFDGDQFDEDQLIDGDQSEEDQSEEDQSDEDQSEDNQCDDDQYDEYAQYDDNKPAIRRRANRMLKVRVYTIIAQRVCPFFASLTPEVSMSIVE